MNDIRTQVKDNKMTKEDGDKEMNKIKEEMKTLRTAARPEGAKPELTKEQKEAQDKLNALKTKMNDIRTQVKDGKMTKEDGDKEMNKLKEEMKTLRTAARPERPARNNDDKKSNGGENKAPKREAKNSNK